MNEKTKVVNKKRPPRIKKNGWVYLLESAESHTFDDGTCVKTYKYGATTKHFTERCRRINYCQKKLTFTPIAAFKSNDIFKDEDNVAYNLIEGGFAKLSEYVCCSSLDDSSEVKKTFLSLAAPFKQKGKPPVVETWEA